MRSLFMSYLFVVLALLGTIGCSKAATPAETSVASPAEKKATVPAIDICSLLTAEEIQKVVGEKPTSVTPSTAESGGLSHSQCLITLPTYSNSIALSVTRRGSGPEARDPREFWDHNIEHPKPREPAEEDEKHSQLEPVSGIGEKALWETTGVGSALYILKGDVFVRFSVGTFGGTKTRREKVLVLAKLVIGRL